MQGVRVSAKAAARVAAGHPWIFRGDVEAQPSAGPGDVVEVRGPGNARLGPAHYSSASLIALRLLPAEAAGAETLGAGFFEAAIGRAQRYRRLAGVGGDAFRLVHAEADFLPGLVIDRYREYFSIQTLSQGMERSKAAIVEALRRLYQPCGIVERNDPAVRRKEGLETVSGVLWGEVPQEIEVSLGEVRVGVDLLRGQKTGLFLDQRENYAAAAAYARGRALDCFCYDGAFALHLARKCDRVEAVDRAAPALERTRRNAQRNGLANIATREASVFDLLRQYDSGGARFETVVLDPPAFAKSRARLADALRGYREINYRAMRLLAAGGVLVTCSCSFHVSEADFLQTVAAASLDAGRNIRVIERRTQARDHPILLTVPETHYLKCLILQAAE